LAAKYLAGKKIKDHVMFRAVPATRQVYQEILSDGTLDTLFKAGVIISHPGCGGCASGQLGMTGENEVQLSTSNRNFKGKQGAGSTYLVSPATAAASAIAGELVSPE
jgi:3-isopropylmalate/(R)-2-methylmalate dehydratase large subunit